MSYLGKQTKFLGAMIPRVVGRLGRRTKYIRPPANLGEGDFAVTWLGHASVAISLGRCLILCDPVYSHCLGLSVGSWGFGCRRLLPRPVLPASICPQYVLISHGHRDHLDPATLEEMPPETRILVPPGCERLIKHPNVGVIAPGSAEIAEQDGIKIEALPAKHSSRSWALGEKITCQGYMIRWRNQRIFFAGDTAFNEDYREFAGGDPAGIAIMPIGGYEPWGERHCTPEQALQMAELGGFKFLLPMHHSTFRLSAEPLEEPLKRLVTCASRVVSVPWAFGKPVEFAAPHGDLR